MTGHRKTQSERAGITFPVSRVRRYLRDVIGKRISTSAAVRLAATMEYLCDEVLCVTTKLIDGKNANNNRNERIKPSHLHQAIRMDPELNAVFGDVVFPQSSFIGRSAETVHRSDTHHSSPHKSHRGKNHSKSHKTPQHKTPKGRHGHKSSKGK